MHWYSTRRWFAYAVLMSFWASPVMAKDGHGHEATELGMFVSKPGNLAYLAIGVGLPLVEDGKDGSLYTRQTVDALAKTILVTEGLKLTFRERRPDSSNRDSFPSAHTSAAFAVAAVQSHYHPKQAPYWYAGATLIGASRVSLHRHYIHDVVAGAAVGYLTAQTSLHHHERYRFSYGAGTSEPSVGVHMEWEF